MFNKLKYPARGDLLIWGIEFVEGTGASYLLQGFGGAPLDGLELLRALEQPVSAAAAA